MDMTNTVRELKTEYDKMVDMFKKKLGEEMFNDESVMDIEYFEFMRNMFHMGDLAMKLMAQQAEIIQKIDGKLDKFDELLEKS